MSERKKDVVKALLRDRLVSGQYKFGERISAKALAEETGASRFMVITALNELRGEGFLEIRAQVGCEVVSPTIRDITDFFVLFSRLEGAIAEFAAERGAAADVARMRDVNEQMAAIDLAHPDAGEAYRILNLDFHHAIHAGAHSPRLAERQSMHWAIADFYVTQASDFREHLGDSAKEHDILISAIERRDKVTAGALMEAHIRRLGQDLVANLTATAGESSPPSGANLQLLP